jgi:hypothetical protein
LPFRAYLLCQIDLGPGAGDFFFYTCQRTCTQAKLVRGLDPHVCNALPPKDLILLMSSNG